MGTQNPSSVETSQHMLLFRGTDWAAGLSPEEMQNVLARWNAWYERLTAEGKAKAGQPLGRDGKVVTGKKGRNVADGPFAESKEAIGGYFLLNVATMEEAVEIARECPGLDYGAAVEVRPVAAHRCGVHARLEELAEATVQVREGGNPPRTLAVASRFRKRSDSDRETAKRLRDGRDV